MEGGRRRRGREDGEASGPAASLFAAVQSTRGGHMQRMAFFAVVATTAMALLFVMMPHSGKPTNAGEPTLHLNNNDRDSLDMRPHQQQEQSEKGGKDETPSADDAIAGQQGQPPACPSAPLLSIKVAMVGNEYYQQFPLREYGGIEASVENLAAGVYLYQQQVKEGISKEWCMTRVEIKELIVVVPRRKETVDVNGQPYPFRIIDTRSPPATATHVWISEVREILAQERPDVIWSQSDWSARGLNSLGIPIICTIQDSGKGNALPSLGMGPERLRYRFISHDQMTRWISAGTEARLSTYLWTGTADYEFQFGPPEEREYFLYVAGRWGRGKGIDFVLELAKRNPDQQFRAYGSSDLEHELNQFAAKHPNFRYSPSLKRGNEHTTAFKRAKAFFAFSQQTFHEAFGRVVTEALSKGTPVIGTPYGSLPELVPSEMGFLSADIEELHKHLNDKFNHTLIYENAKKRHHSLVEVAGLLRISKCMIQRDDSCE